jgi:hypothetical protein
MQLVHGLGSGREGPIEEHEGRLASIHHYVMQCVTSSKATIMANASTPYGNQSDDPNDIMDEVIIEGNNENNVPLDHVLNNKQQQRKQQEYGLARMRSVTTRPSSVAADEFFCNGGTRDWKNLPARLQKLVDALELWVSDIRGGGKTNVAWICFFSSVSYAHCPVCESLLTSDSTLPRPDSIPFTVSFVLGCTEWIARAFMLLWS